MKKSIFAGIIIVSFVFFNCTEKTVQEEKPDSFSYQFVKYEKSYEDCRPGSDTCTYVRIVWPKFETKYPYLQEMIEKYTLSPAYVDESFDSPDSIAFTFLNDYERFRIDFPSAPIFWYIERKMDVAFEQFPVIGFKFREATFMGGAHPNATVSYLNYSAADSTFLNLYDIIKDENEDEFVGIAEKIFRDSTGIESGRLLASGGYWFEEGFELNENFLIERSGLRFLFNPYEIAPYSMGELELFIGWDKFRHLMKEKFVKESGLFPELAGKNN